MSVNALGVKMNLDRWHINNTHKKTGQRKASIMEVKTTKAYISQFLTLSYELNTHIKVASVFMFSLLC